MTRSKSKSESKGKAKAKENAPTKQKKSKKKIERKAAAGKGDSAYELMGELESFTRRLSAVEITQDLDSKFGHLRDRRVFPVSGEEGLAAGSLRKRRRISDDVGDPVEEGQREVLESFLEVIRNTKNYARLSSDELVAFNRVMDEAMLKWGSFQRVNVAEPERLEPQDPENIAF